MILVFIGFAALVAVFAFRAGKSRKTSVDTAKEKGIDILIERFSRGEIDADTFKRMKTELDAQA